MPVGPLEFTLSIPYANEDSRGVVALQITQTPDRADCSGIPAAKEHE